MSFHYTQNKLWQPGAILLPQNVEEDTSPFYNSAVLNTDDLTLGLD